MKSLMKQEALEAPWVIERQFKENRDVWSALCDRLHKINVPFAMTVARGSSDHASTFMKYLLETKLGLVTASAAPSVLTVYGQALNTKNSLVIGVSQSGKSPDICEMMKSARAAGAVTVAIVNHVESPLAKLAEFVVPMWAGEEIAVAATKSYIASLSAALQFWSIYSGDAALSAALSALPETLKKASECNWTSLGAGLKNAVNTLVLGRGFGFPVAQEAALKFKETSSIHGEAFSSAEVMHGPMGLVRNQLPLLMVTQNDATLAGNIALAEKLQQIGGKPFVALPKGLNVPGVEKLKNVLPLPKSLHPLCDPLMAIQAFYPMAADLAVSRGFNPDSPQNLKKVTETR